MHNYYDQLHFFLYSDEIHRKSEQEMTEIELKQKEADRKYFHSNRDANKDGYMDQVMK